MCEIFGLSSLNDVELNGCLRTFYSHSRNHPHGWGLACISRDGALIEKESIRALDSNYLKERLSQPVREKIPTFNYDSSRPVERKEMELDEAWYYMI